MEFQNWTLNKNGIRKLDPGQKWNSEIGPWPKMQFQNKILAKNGIPNWPKMEFQIWTLAKNGIPFLANLEFHFWLGSNFGLIRFNRFYSFSVVFIRV